MIFFSVLENLLLLCFSEIYLKSKNISLLIFQYKPRIWSEILSVNQTAGFFKILWTKCAICLKRQLNCRTLRRAISYKEFDGLPSLFYMYKDLHQYVEANALRQTHPLWTKCGMKLIFYKLILPFLMGVVWNAKLANQIAEFLEGLYLTNYLMDCFDFAYGLRPLSKLLKIKL